MPYKEISNRLAYRRGYYAGYRRATIDHLGNKCFKCGTTENLEIDHIKPLERKSRTIKDLKDVTKIQLLCKKCNKDKEKRH